MKISIVTVCFNSADTIRDTIESVTAQDYKDIEYIIVDGGSTDNTLEIVKEYEGSVSHLMSEGDDGIYDAMNKGIRAATGDVIATLNSDDFYADSSSVSSLVSCMEKAQTDTVFADLVIVDNNDTSKTIRYYDSSAFSRDKLRNGWMPAHPTFLAKRALFEKWGLYSLEYKIAADFEMMVRLFYRAGVSYTYLPRVVVKMRAGGVSTAGLHSSLLLNNEILRACRENGLATNLLHIMMKIPSKFIQYFRRPKLRS